MATSPKLTGIISQATTIVGSLRSRGATLSGVIGVPLTTGTPLVPATTYSLGGIIVGEDLQITPEGILSVQKATDVESDNTHPITSAAVYTTVGNINALLATI